MTRRSLFALIAGAFGLRHSPHADRDVTPFLSEFCCQTDFIDMGPAAYKTVFYTVPLSIYWLPGASIPTTTPVLYTGTTARPRTGRLEGSGPQGAQQVLKTCGGR